MDREAIIMFQQLVQSRGALASRKKKKVEFEMAEDEYNPLLDQEEGQTINVVMVEPPSIACGTTDYIVVAIFWTALILNSVSQMFTTGTVTSETDLIGPVLEGVATFLYAINVYFLIFKGIPCLKGSKLRGLCCTCSCRSREYAITSTVFFCFSIGSFILNVTFLG